jgi:hypothetical protein
MAAAARIAYAGPELPEPIGVVASLAEHGAIVTDGGST